MVLLRVLALSDETQDHVWKFLGAQLPWNVADCLYIRARCYLTCKGAMNGHKLYHLRAQQEVDEKFEADSHHSYDDALSVHSSVSLPSMWDQSEQDSD